MEETALIRMAQTGDREAFRRLFEIHREKIFALAYNYLKNAEDAEDVLQETFVRAYRHLGRFRIEESSNLAGWLNRIGVNCSMDSFRKNRMKTQRIDDAETWGCAQNPDRNSDPAHSREMQEIREKLDAIVDNFPAKQRMAFVLRHERDLKIREIADGLGCSEGAVKKMLFRSFETIKKRMKKFLGEKSYEMP